MDDSFMKRGRNNAGMLPIREWVEVALVVHFFNNSSCASLCNRGRPIRKKKKKIRTRTVHKLKNCCSAKSTIVFILKGRHHICLKSILILQIKNAICSWRRWNIEIFVSPWITTYNRNVLAYQYVEHHIEFVSHDRDYSHVDVHEQAMRSTKTKERPIEKRVDIKKKKKKKLFALIFKTGYELILLN